mmetsp:Transcript_33492/g.77207  ORF Transcript_33492/g.77207 Transcript_33492/m.77207 type:complete len:224 (+) Transcript_33492:2-673(+)
MLDEIVPGSSIPRNKSTNTKMVSPLDMLDEIVPTEEVAELRLCFKWSILGLVAVCTAELVCGMYSAALIDLATLLPGLMMLQQTLAQLVYSVLKMGLLASLNMVWQVVLLFRMLSTPPGPAHFFSTECKVADPDDASGTHQVNMCSRYTAVGHAAVCSSIVLQLLCARYACQMAKRARRETPAPWAQPLELSDFVAATTQVLPPSENPGYTPFTGRAYRLGVD